MKSFLKIGFISLVSLGLLGGCGGGKPPITNGGSSSSGSSSSGSSSSGSGSGSGSNTSTAAQGVSYLPLDVYEAFKAYSQYPSDGMFEPAAYMPDTLVQGYLINPVDANTLQSISTAVASDYVETIDDIPIDPAESYPMLQKVIGDPVTLKTALVFDVSQSMYQVDIPALVAEAKAYVTACQASSNPIIANQQFVVWAFASKAHELTSGFTSNAATIDSALDDVVTQYNTAGLGSATNLHGAIIEAVGRYIDTSKGYDFLDADQTPTTNNDLVDEATQDYIHLSQLVLFSSGPDTYLEFSKQKMIDAIHSQSFQKYDPAADPASNTMTSLYKPVFYYVVGGTSPGVPDTDLSPEAEQSINLTLTASNTYSFASSLISNQLDAINKRIDLTDEYFYRYAFLPRVGDHKAVFSSNSTGHSFSLYTDYKDADINQSPAVPAVSPRVEITGPNGEYLANKTASLSEVSTFRGMTLWTHNSYNYTWTPSGITGSMNADQSYTVTGITGPGPHTLTVSNGVTTPDFIINITN